MDPRVRGDDNIREFSCHPGLDPRSMDSRLRGNDNILKGIRWL
jgi:hypothetical protein